MPIFTTAAMPLSSSAELPDTTLIYSMATTQSTSCTLSETLAPMDERAADRSPPVVRPVSVPEPCWMADFAGAEGLESHPSSHCELPNTIDVVAPCRGCLRRLRRLHQRGDAVQESHV